MPRKPKELPPDPHAIWKEYPFLNSKLDRSPVKKIKRIAEISYAASITEIQVPVHRMKVNPNGQTEAETVMSEKRRIGNYEEIFRILLMKGINECDLTRDDSR